MFKFLKQKKNPMSSRYSSGDDYSKSKDKEEGT